MQAKTGDAAYPFRSRGTERNGTLSPS